MNQVVGWKCNRVETPIGGFRRVFGLLEWSWVIFLKRRGTPPLEPWILARWDGQPGSWGLDVGCSRHAAAGRVVGQAMLADRWIEGDTRKEEGERKEEKEDAREKHKKEKMQNSWRGNGRRKGESIFLGEVGEESVRLDYLLLYLIFFWGSP